MPLGTPAQGSAVVIQIGTTSGTVTTVVGGNKTWNWVGDSPQSTDDFYGQPSVTNVGKTTRSIDVHVVYETADSGHAILYAAFGSKATIWFKLLPDGTNGETLPVKVAHQEIHGPDVNGPCAVDWTFAQQGDPTVVGTGFGT